MPRHRQETAPTERHRDTIVTAPARHARFHIVATADVSRRRFERTKGDERYDCLPERLEAGGGVHAVEGRAETVGDVPAHTQIEERIVGEQRVLERAQQAPGEQGLEDDGQANEKRDP